MSQSLFDRIAGAHSRAAKEHPDGSWSVTLTQVYDHPLAEVWDCWTDLERLARWFGRLDRIPAVGGSTTMTMLGNGGDANVYRQTIGLRACEPGRRVLVDWGGFGEGPSVVEVGFEALGSERTLLTVVHAGLVPGEARGYGAGWAEVLERARIALATGVGFDPAELDSSGVEAYMRTTFWNDLIPPR